MEFVLIIALLYVVGTVIEYFTNDQDSSHPSTPASNPLDKKRCLFNIKKNKVSFYNYGQYTSNIIPIITLDLLSSDR